MSDSEAREKAISMPAGPLDELVVRSLKTLMLLEAAVISVSNPTGLKEGLERLEDLPKLIRVTKTCPTSYCAQYPT